MSDDAISWVLGLFSGLILSIGIASVNPYSSMNKIDRAISECEKSLPRDQHCVMVGVPEVKK